MTSGHLAVSLRIRLLGPTLLALLLAAAAAPAQEKSLSGSRQGKSDPAAAPEEAPDSLRHRPVDRPRRLILTSPDLLDGREIPRRFTCRGENVSPALVWDGVPAETRSFTLVCEDLDVPDGGWIHWLVYDLSWETLSVREQVEREQDLPLGARLGRNSWGEPAWGGPCPPRGERHRYLFTLYALTTPLRLDPGATVDEVFEAMAGLVLDWAELEVTYLRLD